MAISVIEGNVHRYICINTTEYNGDGKYCVQDCSYDELVEIGWDLEEKYPTYFKNGVDINIKDMSVGEIIIDTFYQGVYLMRVA